jgi:hypothetical protein
VADPLPGWIVEKADGKLEDGATNQLIRNSAGYAAKR